MSAGERKREGESERKYKGKVSLNTRIEFTVTTKGALQLFGRN